MKKSLFSLLALLVAGSVSAQTVLTYSDHEPYGNMRTRFINDVFFKNVEAESNGRIKIEAHWGGEITTAHKEFEAIEEKRTDLIVAVPEYNEKRLPLHQLFKSFLIGPSGNKQVETLRQIYQNIPELTAEYHEEIKEYLQNRVDEAQTRYNSHPSRNNRDRLDRANKDLSNVIRDGEVLIKGTVPKEYIMNTND